MLILLFERCLYHAARLQRPYIALANSDFRHKKPDLRGLRLDILLDSPPKPRMGLGVAQEFPPTPPWTGNQISGTPLIKKAENLQVGAV